MISMDNWATKAFEKLDKEREQIPAISPDKVAEELRKKPEAARASLMADAVLEVLKDLCKQNDAFAEAVVAGGSFVDCMKAVTNGLGYYAEGNSCCKKAVRFYSPKAEFSYQLSVSFPGEKDNGGAAKHSIIDLGSFFS